MPLCQILKKQKIACQLDELTARKLIMKSQPTAVKNKGIRRHLRKKIHSESTSDILKYYKTEENKNVDTNVHGTIISFNEKDNVSFRNMTKVVCDQFALKKRDHVRVLEFTNKDAFDLFC